MKPIDIIDNYNLKEAASTQIKNHPEMASESNELTAKIPTLKAKKKNKKMKKKIRISWLPDKTMHPC